MIARTWKIGSYRRGAGAVALLILALIAPCAASSRAESLLPPAEEVEMELEDAMECLAAAQCRRYHRIRQASLHVCEQNWAGCSVPVGHHRTCHLVYFGHRFDNGLLAPLTC